MEKILCWLSENVVNLIIAFFAYASAVIAALALYFNSKQTKATEDSAKAADRSAVAAEKSANVAEKSMDIAEQAKEISKDAKDASLRSADISEKMYNESYRPEIQIRLARVHGGMSSKGTIYLFIDNVGSMPCKDITIKISPKLNIIFNEKQKPFEEKYNQFKLIGNSHTLEYDYINSKSSVTESLERCVFVNPEDETDEYYHKTNHTFEIEYCSLSESVEDAPLFKSKFTSSLNTLLNMNPI